LIVTAALDFGKAAELVDKAGNAAKLAELNAYLFWCKKSSAPISLNLFQKGTDPRHPAHPRPQNAWITRSRNAARDRRETLLRPRRRFRVPRTQEFFVPLKMVHTLVL